MIALFRWYHKAKEAERLCQLQETVEEFDERHQDDGVEISGIVEDDWRLIKAYLEVVKPFMNASKLLGGDTYPAATMVIPMLDQLLADLKALPEKMAREEERRQRQDRRDGRVVIRSWGPDGEGRRLVAKAVSRFQVRFPDCLKFKAPFNGLCLVNPVNIDLYFENEEEIQAAVSCIKEDKVFRSLREVENQREEENQNIAPVVLLEVGEVDTRRAQLLARRTQVVVVQENLETFEQKLDQEIARFRLVVPVSKDTNPLQWWAANEKEYPLLALFMKSNGAMQPTSLASERLFNKDKLLFGTTRVMLTEEHAEGLIFLHDYLNKRMVSGQFEPCSGCPNAPQEGANYRLSCPKHNGT